MSSRVTKDISRSRPIKDLDNTARKIGADKVSVGAGQIGAKLKKQDRKQDAKDISRLGEAAKAQEASARSASLASNTLTRGRRGGTARLGGEPITSFRRLTP